MKLDKYYRELIAKERKEFQRILISKLNCAVRETERKYAKQNKESKARLSKAMDGEKRVESSHEHAKRLQKQIDALKKKNGALEGKLGKYDTENCKLKIALENLW